MLILGTVKRVMLTGSKVCGVQVDDYELPADAVLIALGPWSNHACKKLVSEGQFAGYIWHAGAQRGCENAAGAATSSLSSQRNGRGNYFLMPLHLVNMFKFLLSD